MGLSAATSGAVSLPFNNIVFNLVFNLVDRDKDGALDREEMFWLIIKFVEFVDKKKAEKEAAAKAGGKKALFQYEGGYEFVFDDEDEYKYD